MRLIRLITFMIFMMLLKCWFLSCRLLLTSGQRPPVITPGTARCISLPSLDQMAVICRTGIVCAEHLQHAGSADGLPGFHPAIFMPGTANRHPLSSLNQTVTLFTVPVSNGLFLNRDSAVQNYIQNSANKILYKKQPLFLISFCKICRFLREHTYKLRQKGDNLRKIGICLDNLFTLVCITALCLTRERAAASAAGKRKSRHRRLPCRRCLLSVSCNMLVIHALQEGDLLPCKRWPCGM